MPVGVGDVGRGTGFLPFGHNPVFPIDAFLDVCLFKLVCVDVSQSCVTLEYEYVPDYI